MAWEFPGSKNTNGYTKFRFACNDGSCRGGIGQGGFRASYEEAPEFVPSGMPCPFGGDHDATWVIDKGPSVHIHGSAGGVQNPHYTTAKANAEHQWMGMQIEEAKKAVNAEDQLTGKAVSPYGKYTLNTEEAEKRGVIRKAGEEETAERDRIMQERSKVVCDQATDKLTEIERKHAGRRHDG